MNNKREIGNEYENKAVRFLESNGFIIIDRNFYARQGEIDIIARDGNYLVFIEVKYRSGLNKGYPQEAINFVKKKRIINTAKFYMHCNKIPVDTPVRFDVVSVLGEEVLLIKDAFWIE